MVAASGYRTKKELKAAVGQSLRYVETSLFGSEYTTDGTFNVVGPSAYDRRWYATVSMRDGKIAKVS
jgi:hypothetical protein